ncbi:hypothetical protein SAY87_009617 [Trapa incisa]|uniref:Uncharacterized protein n=1 Tax=Trapa incisa TaxID=236973 RepID=A0AAN7K1F3_9MYRT|nr:hypothetical protein SAY87_009617 [Trapa incisa]
MVLKGINHGACGYLLKPVRMQEVKNIWQHVYRRKKVMLEDQTLSRISCVDEPPREKVGKKRRDENGNRGDNLQRQDEDPSRTRKKTRLNWSPELHMKFIAVVNQLGIEKAVPKKILEMMDDVNLTREHIASHLQKYRLTLKRVSQMENEQGRAPLFACSSFSYAQSGLRGRDGVASFSQFLGPGKFQGRALMPSLTSPVLAQSTTNQPSHAQGSHDFKFTDRTVDSFPCWTQDMATSSHSCFTRSQDWYSHSPIHVACNEPAKQESSTPSYNIHEDPAAFLLPVEVDSGESHCQGAHIDMVLQESLAFTEQPDTGLPSIPSLHGL